MFTDVVSIIQYKISVWGAEKTDRSISDEVCQSKNADTNAGKFIKSLLGGKCDELKAIQNYAQMARLALKRITLPYQNGLMVPNSQLINVIDQIQAIRHQFNILVDEFVEVYPDIIQRAKERNSELFDERLCPHDVRSKFAFTFHVEPLPDSNMFDRSLGLDTLKEQIKLDLENQMKQVFKNAENELINRLEGRAKVLYDRLSDFDSKRQLDNRLFKTSLKLVDECLRLNVTNNSEVIRIADTLTQVCTKDGEFYRSNPLDRNAAITVIGNLLGIAQQPVEVDDELEAALGRV